MTVKENFEEKCLFVVWQILNIMLLIRTQKLKDDKTLGSLVTATFPFCMQ